MASMSADRKCERCEEEVGTIACNECAGKEDSEPLVYCAECSTLVHKGRVAKHKLVTFGVQVEKAKAEECIKEQKILARSLRSRCTEVAKHKRNVKQLMQSYEESIRHSIIDICRQLKDRGKEFIQQMSARCEQKAGMLAELDARLQDAEKTLAKHTAALEAGVAGCDSSALVAALAENKAYVMELREMLCSIELPVLQTQFSVDYSAVTQAVSALQISLHPDVEESEENLKLDTVDIVEGTEIKGFVSGVLNKRGVFWLLPTFSDETTATLDLISQLIRERFIKSADWLSLGVSGTEPMVGVHVYALYEADQRWYRGRIEEVHNTRHGSLVRFLDYGNTQVVAHDNMLPTLDDFAKNCPFQAIECSIVPNPDETTLPNEPRWAFSDTVQNDSIRCRFINKVTCGASSDVWHVQVSVQNGEETVDANQVVQDKLLEMKEPKSTITCRDIRYMNNGQPAAARPRAEPTVTVHQPTAALAAPPQGEMQQKTPEWSVPDWKPKEWMPKEKASDRPDWRSEEQREKLAKIQAILGDGGMMKRAEQAGKRPEKLPASGGETTAVVSLTPPPQQQEQGDQPEESTVVNEVAAPSREGDEEGHKVVTELTDSCDDCVNTATITNGDDASREVSPDQVTEDKKYVPPSPPVHSVATDGRLPGADVGPSSEQTETLPECAVDKRTTERETEEQELTTMKAKDADGDDGDEEEEEVDRRDCEEPAIVPVPPVGQDTAQPEQPHDNADVCVIRSLPVTSEPAPINHFLPQPKLHHGGEFAVYVTGALQPNGQFWSELVRSEHAELAYEHLLGQLKEFSRYAPCLQHSAPGQLVLAPGSKDSWHRGLIESVTGNKASVCLIDKGRKVVLPADSLKQLDSDCFRRIPYQAVLCSIARQEYRIFGPKAIQYFRSITQAGRFIVKVISIAANGAFAFVDLFTDEQPQRDVFQLIYDEFPEDRTTGNPEQVPSAGDDQCSGYEESFPLLFNPACHPRAGGDGPGFEEGSRSGHSSLANSEEDEDRDRDCMRQRRDRGQHQRGPRCYGCEQFGHIHRMCPHRTDTQTDGRSRYDVRYDTSRPDSRSGGQDVRRNGAKRSQRKSGRQKYPRNPRPANTPRGFMRDDVAPPPTQEQWGE